MIEFLKCSEEYEYILGQIKADFKKQTTTIDESKVENSPVMDFEKKIEEFVPKEFLNDYNEIGQIKPDEILTYEFPYQLEEKYPNSLETFKKLLMPTIQNVHAPIAKANNVGAVFNENQLIEFEKKHYNIDLRELKFN